MRRPPLHGHAGLVRLPARGVRHGFIIVGTQPLHGLVLTQPAGFDQFVTEMGEPALTRTSPPSMPSDLAKLTTLAGKYGIELHIPAGIGPGGAPVGS